MYLRFEKKDLIPKQKILKLSDEIAHQSHPSAFFKVSSV